MRKKITIPRIIKIEKIEGFLIKCMFNNGESRQLDFSKIFNEWGVSEKDTEHVLLNENEFKKVQLRNFTLSWENVPVTLIDEEGNEQVHPYEIGADILYKLSAPVAPSKALQFGNMIKNARLKAGLTQEQLALRSGTSRFYISRLENDKADIELSTFRKIVEAGLGLHLRLVIE